MFCLGNFGPNLSWETQTQIYVIFLILRLCFKVEYLTKN